MFKYIGSKQIKNINKTDDHTPGGISIVEVEYEDGSVERFSSLLIDKITTEEISDESALREKRVFPVVNVVLAVLRDWGIKMGELPYFSVMLNQSLNYNHDEALKEIWSQWMKKPQSLDDVDLIAIDRVLKSIPDAK